MHYILSFVVLIIIEWMLCMCCADAHIAKSIVRDVNSRELIKKKWEKYFCVIVCIEMVLFAGFRSLDIGADTGSYLKALNYYKNFSRDKILSAKLVYPFNFEIGYFFLTKLCAYLNFSSTMFLLLIATVTYIPLFIFIYRYSKNPLISVLTYFSFGLFAYSVGLFRQMIALSICLCAVPCIKKKKLLLYLLLCAFASLFHLSALIMIPLYFFEYLDLRKYRIGFYVLIIAIEVVCFVFARKIILKILEFIPHYVGYIGGKYDVQGGSYFNLIFLNILLVLGMFIVVPRVDKGDTLCVKGIAVACIIQSCSYAMGIMGRLVCYYSIYEMLLIPLVAENIAKEKSIVKIMAVLVLFSLLIWTLSRDNYIQNYTFLWG